MLPIDIRRLGGTALQIRVPAGSVEALRQRLADAPLPGQRAVVAGGATVSVTFSSAAATVAAARALRELPVPPHVPSTGPIVDIDVVYDGEDLDEVARLTGVGTQAVIERHTAQQWHVAFVGFAPGFAYLRGDLESPVVPRRPTPRVRVPSGTVAVAGGYSAVYPRPSPGGWQLIGHTDAPLWDVDRDPPAMLVPGTRVRFRAVRAVAAVPATTRGPVAAVDAAGLRIHAVGPQTLIQDRGRDALAPLGITRSGVADRGAADQANRLVGNDAGAAVLENTGGGLVLASAVDQVLAVTGADSLVAVTTEAGYRVVPRASAFPLWAGEVLEIDPPEAGLRVVVAVRGGIDVPTTLGSRATDVLSGLGPDPVEAGDVLPVGRQPRTAVGAPEAPAPVPSAVGTVIDVIAGPDSEWFPAEALTAFTSREWTVTPDSNRIGVRFAGEPLDRRSGDMESQAMVTGAIQVPPSGLPVAFLADHPTTGGYPVIGVVAPDHLDALAQLPIGATVRFRFTD
ncbi:Allophanate hydrolase subunit 2 OS=Tsukamurella paurometabola (strain ATCC 8368 / DSM / CCUG 35730 / CIP 100753 / JCM 10117 / KCTC 9821 / NBRC 16120 / NCIMB 702349 / NCTC 13040) OX=521096 GN=Tpau_3520 PE=4 SV=1 [Tsukamurella paurometabola]|uniref:Allophanate hydrolase subunit 2 n=1 Tax=Tsukamurella paurometabola (strain ATCC 8368 / DSM 20162 / CCUG 35730 / CIP 100753 / JCM 10117 / KCTC 9821 / NBRC 16120 / NCIMB 702349 / NCTC 13040) TaxID=521096 RepID=D5UX80_TSUPD|nr:5-oxoprolinase/urea amidolyase family protein [Tsukamurella paurometabola]ADG80099.1 Allophanate hydrolase subunit 2 [Tsukamurella paurometabola DSM 20162]SUP38415.1 Sporulation inhibitor kipI [Tsukamurella paurometabola]